MKKYLSTCLILVFIFFSCGGNVSKNPEDIKNVKTDSIVATNVLDSIAMIANSIDSLRNRGALFHLDKYAIGKFKGIEVSVEKSSIESKSLTYINLRKDCGGEYYYSWEDARIYQKELPSLYSAINSIKDNLGRNVDHEELIAYTTKDLVTIKAECKDANKWKISAHSIPDKSMTITVVF